MLKKVFTIMNKTVKSNFFKELVTSDSHISSKSFFLVATTVIGILLLCVPIIALTLDAVYNHTIMTDLNGMAAYIGSVATLFATAGITKAWADYGESKFRGSNPNNETTTTYSEETTEYSEH